VAGRSGTVVIVRREVPPKPERVRIVLVPGSGYVGPVLVAAAFCPAPPVLVPDVASGAAAELDDVRSAAFTAIDALSASDPDLLVLVGEGPEGEFPSGSRGTLAGFGVDVTATLVPAAAVGAAGGTEPARMPVSLTVGAWMVAQSGWSGPLMAMSVPDDLLAHAAAERGERWAARASRVAMLVLGESSARLEARAPGGFDPDAPSMHAVVRDALVTVDPDTLLGLDPARARHLMVSGRGPWQVAAGAARAAASSSGERGGVPRGFRGELRVDEAPYGVGYLVVSWSPQ